MATSRLLGYTGLYGYPWLDDGTLCLQPSPCPGILGLGALNNLDIRGPILVGKAKREPGYNFDGTQAEDMMYADKPLKSASIQSDPVFKQTDGELNKALEILMKSLSIGAMEDVAMVMHERFVIGQGGTFTSSTLNKEVRTNSAFATYHGSFLSDLLPKLKAAAYDPGNIARITMNLLNFSSFWDKASGLGITVHQVWSAKAEIKNYHLDRCNGFWGFDLVYTFYDHFGLDWEDVVKNGGRRLPQYHTGDFFKAWYILQHYRNAKPFITEMQCTMFVGGRI